MAGDVASLRALLADECAPPRRTTPPSALYPVVAVVSAALLGAWAYHAHTRERDDDDPLFQRFD
jgi:hypothetical protein